MSTKSAVVKTLLVVVVVAAAATLPGSVIRFYRFATDSTVYSPGYSEPNFESIKLGMTYNDVLARVGEPISVSFGDAKSCLAYSKSDSDGSYYLRCVYLDPNGVVVRKIADWYQD